LLDRCGLGDDPDFAPQFDRARWPGQKEKMAKLFKGRKRAEWCEILEGTDVCFAPVLSLADAPRHPHNRARSTFVEVDDVVQPAPAPRFGRTPGAISGKPPANGEHTLSVLAAAGFSEQEISRLQAQNVI
jgi:alpha-methylacyl-CoA racemase